MTSSNLSRRRPRRAALALAAGLVSACGGGEPSGRAAALEDSARLDGPDTLAVPMDGVADAAARDTVEARLAVSIGEEEGAAEYLFGSITGLAVDGRGRVYVSDRLTGSVRVYESGGRHVATVGRDGDGPGEFRWPVGPVVDDGGALFVRDQSGVSHFMPRSPGAAPDSFVARWPGPVYGFHEGPTRLDGQGRLYFPRTIRPRTGSTHHYFLVYSHGAAVDSIMVPSMPGNTGGAIFVRTGPSGGRMVHGLDRAPFMPMPSWDVTSRGTLLVSRGDIYLVAELRGRDTVRVLGRPDEASLKIDRRERRDSALALAARIDTLPVPIEQVQNVPADVRAQRLPEVYPAVVAVHAAANGLTWVERWPPTGDSGGSFFDAWDADGAFLGTVRVPARFSGAVRPVFAQDLVWGVVTDRETGVARVAGFRFTLPEPRAGRIR